MAVQAIFPQFLKAAISSPPWRQASTFLHQRWHLATEAMGDPGLLQTFPDIPPLLPQVAGHGEQAAAADRSTGRMDAIADLALNHRCSQGWLGGVVGGLDPLNLQKGRQAIGHLQQLLVGVHRLGPRRSLASLVAQIHHPLQRCHKRLAVGRQYCCNVVQSILPSL